VRITLSLPEVAAEVLEILRSMAVVVPEVIVLSQVKLCKQVRLTQLQSEQAVVEALTVIIQLSHRTAPLVVGAVARLH